MQLILFYIFSKKTSKDYFSQCHYLDIKLPKIPQKTIKDNLNSNNFKLSLY